MQPLQKQIRLESEVFKRERFTRPDKWGVLEEIRGRTHQASEFARHRDNTESLGRQRHTHEDVDVHNPRRPFDRSAGGKLIPGRILPKLAAKFGQFWTARIGRPQPLLGRL